MMCLTTWLGFLPSKQWRSRSKAVLTAHGIPFRKTHALSYLVGLVEENRLDIPSMLEEAASLTPWAIGFRYEDDDPPVLDRAAVLTLVEQLRKWAEAQIVAVSDNQKREVKDRRADS
jgi:hypothetical protein